MSIYLSVIVPIYNERFRFVEGLEHYAAYLNKQDYSWELILVNDGSTDKTESLVKKSIRAKTHIKFVSYKKNVGKGYAIVQGVKHAKGKYILFTDIDHSVSIKTVEAFFDYFKRGYKIVIGSRRAKGARFLKKQPFLREFLGRGFSALVRLLIYWDIKDTTCGFKAFERSAAKKLFSKVTIYKWAFDAELICIARKLEYKIAQVPVEWKDARGSKVTVKKDIVNSLLDLVRIKINDFSGKY